MRNSKVKGFTLVELIVVIAIIAILAAILVPNMLGYIRNSRFTQADSNAKNVHTAATAAIAQAYADGKIGTDTENYLMYTVYGKDTSGGLRLCIDLGDMSAGAVATATPATGDNAKNINLKTGLGEDFVGQGFFWVSSKSVSVTHAAWASKNITVPSDKAADNVVCVKRNKSSEDDIVGWFPTPVDVEGDEASVYQRPGEDVTD